MSIEFLPTPKPRSKKNPTEFFPTPLPLITALLQSGRIPLDGNFLEACAGHGAIITATTRYCASLGLQGPSWTGIELLPALAKAAATRCPEATIICGDALTTPIEPQSLILSNPPFSLAERLYRRLRPLSTYLVFLLRVGWLESSCRQELLMNDLPEIGIISPRPSFSSGGNDNATYAWMLWGPERRPESRVWICRTKATFQLRLI